MCKWKFRSLARRILISGVLISLPLNAQLKKMQAQDLVDRTARKHPEITGLELSATHAGPRDCVTIAATDATDLGGKCDRDEATALITLKPFVERELDGFDVTAPLHDANGKLIGTLGIDFKSQVGQTKADILKRTAQLLKEVEQQIPSKGFLFQPVSGNQ
jgi:hypothetical protein